MIARSTLLLALTLSLSTASAQSSGDLLAVRATTGPHLAAPLDVAAIERTTVLLDALLQGDRTPLGDAVAPDRARMATADFGRYLNTVIDEIGVVQAYRVVRVQAHERAATAILVQVNGEHGWDVLRFVWRDGDLVLLNRGPRTVR